MVKRQQDEERVLAESRWEGQRRETGEFDKCLGVQVIEKTCRSFEKSKKKKSLKKGEAKGSTHWYQVKKTVANKPKPRAYLTGSKEKGGKFKLIVEVSHQRPPNYLKVTDTIKEKLEQEHLSKRLPWPWGRVCVLSEPALLQTPFEKRAWRFWKKSGAILPWGKKLSTLKNLQPYEDFPPCPFVERALHLCKKVIAWQL